MYRALYRKWRPQFFADIIGQESITTALKNQINAGKVAHAYLFTGSRGTGKTTCAKVFAKAVNCENPAEAEPCGQCAMCRGLEDGSILDVAEIDAASNNGVDDVRDLRDETMFNPSRGRYKVYIIDEVHMLTTQAFNALLKTLEEPPSHVIFILATTEIHKVPATILSRCQRFDFFRIPPEKIAGRLQFVAGQETINLTEGAADLIARLADGSMRDALSLLDTCAGVEESVDEGLVRRMAGVADKGYLFDISAAAFEGDTARLMALVNQLHGQSIDVRRLCEELVFHYRNLLLAKAGRDGSLLEDIPQQDRQRYAEGGKAYGEGYLIASMRRLAAALDNMSRTPDPRIELELALFDLGEQVALAGTQPPFGGALPQAGAARSSAPSPVAVASPPVPQGIPPALSAQPVAPMQEALLAPPVAAAPMNEPLEVAGMAAEGGAPAGSASSANAPPVQDAFADGKPATEPQGGVTVAVEEALPADGGVVAFTSWPQVLQQMAAVDRMLNSYMIDTTAFTDGSRVLIQGGDVFLSYMRENESAREKIKTVIQQVTGKRYGIGPYENPGQNEGKSGSATEKTLQEWEAMGVEISYE